MRHGILVFSLLVLFGGAAGGVFILVHQSGGKEEVAQEVLVASTGLQKEKQAEQSVSAVKVVLVPLPAPPPTQIPPPPSPLPPPQASVAEKININTASYEELQKITGVGEVIAQRIIDYRNVNGPFEQIEDIKNVKGIGDVSFEKMKDEIAT